MGTGGDGGPEPDAESGELEMAISNLEAAAGGFGIEREREQRRKSTSNTVSGGTVHGGVVQTGSVGSVYLGVGTQGTSLPTLDDWPRMYDLLPLDLGVRTSRTFREEIDLTPYAERDGDARLHGLVRDCAARGGLVLVTGERLSGKTRTAYRALLNSLGRRARVFAPGPGTDLQGLPALLRGRGSGPYAVWLDDLEGHLGEHGLTPGLLTQLIRQRMLVVATMSDHEYEKHRFGTSASARVLARAEPAELASRWSDEELSRLEELSSRDLRLSGAIEWRGDSGVTEYLAIGPDLWAEWRHARRPSAHPRGHLLVRAAIDLARYGIREPVPQELLRSVHELYGAGGAGVSLEPFEEALAWATEIRNGVSGLLVAGPEAGTWRAYGSLVADAVRSPDAVRLPYRAWMYVLSALRSRAPGADAVLAAARTALLPDAEAGDAKAMYWLASVCHEQDRAEAARWYAAAADADPQYAYEAGKYLAERGDVFEAMPYLRTAAEADSRLAAALLGRLMRDQAEHWLRVAAEDGDEESAQELSDLVSRPRRAEWAVVYQAAQDLARDL
ncbi:sel1 repeat family protein [Streptomyces sp. GMY02]|uniref:sel1 repeat family protein n=1 Tax=Streptomyces sp. GMY02 TaxID=1333528 RepID=UPI001C2C0984|nr:sel1 repeat family protein [Streptomyces sp. GMY02]QXE36500.1 sel1 repeat family protein [Streptomyces sp. GMY02]